MKLLSDNYGLGLELRMSNVSVEVLRDCVFDARCSCYLVFKSSW